MVTIHDQEPELVKNGDVGVKLVFSGGPCTHPINFLYQSNGMQSYDSLTQLYPSVISTKRVICQSKNRYQMSIQKWHYMETIIIH